MATSVSTNINDLNYYSQLQTEIESAARSLDRLISQQGVSGLEAANIRNTYRDLAKEFKGLNSLADRYNNGQLKTKDIAKEINKATADDRRLAVQIEKAQIAGNRQLEQRLITSQRIGNKLQSELTSLQKANEQIDKRLGLTGKLISAAGKIPIVGDLLNIEEATQNMRILASETDKSGKFINNKFKIIGEGIRTSFEGIGDKLTGAAIFKFILESANKADKQVTALAKSLVITKGEAEDIRQKFVGASRAIGDSFITTDKLLESQSKLSEQLGISKLFSGGILKEFTTLTGKIGLSEESAAGLAKISIAIGKATRQVTTNTVASIEKVKQETGLRLDNKKILEATGKVSGQLLANFKANPAAIAEAIAKTQALGTSLEQAKAQGESLLNFESSIDNELKAELITGKQINLERARMAALMGDQKTVAEELSAQAVDFNKFSEMNVIAQKSLAEALGTSADALSDQLFKQQYLNKSKEQILALGGEEAVQRMEALSAQDKFNNAVTKLQDLLGNLVAGPMGRLIDGLASAASSATAVYSAMVAIAGLSLGRTIASLAAMAASLGLSAAGALTTASAITFGIGIVAVIAAIAAGMGAFNSAKEDAIKMKDGFIDPSSGTVIQSEAGTFQTRPDDKILVGTNISPNGGGINTTSIDLTPMISAINEVRASVDRLYNKNTTISMDSKQVGSTLVQSSYKLA